MEEYLKRCESATMKSSKAMEEGVQMISGKKRKLYTKLENEYCGDVESVENCVSPAASRTSSGCSKHDESNDVVKESLRSPDLKNVDTQSDGFETEISTSINGGVFSREATPTSELCGDSEEVLLMSSSSTSKKTPEIPRRKIPSEKMPSAAELEEFFAAAEKCEQKRFAEKYNYDIVKDVPLEGKYQWVRLRL
ncbi:hypothetical protein BUALT_Bualt15G0036000 [Buddleja alternifolia]|uniref:Cyclin-dependent kinase inhibitor n=1 Tax=Buddleja alternifolia TaxID=168488 RepID=A0AAV6WCZ2_9LAMI|nr:hypothetical protein BUALT_Bualt15G0036000 [Buddleja alternifolia]